MIYNTSIGATNNLESGKAAGNSLKVEKISEDPSKDFNRMLKSSQEKIKDNESTGDDIAPLMMPFGQIQAMFSNAPSYSSSARHDASDRGQVLVGDLHAQSVKKDPEDRNGKKESSDRSDPAANKDAGSKIQEALAKILSEGSAKSAEIGGLVSFNEFIKNLEKVSGKENIRSIAETILGKIKLLKIGDKTEFSMELKPAWLGNIKVDITSDKGFINIRIYAGEKSKELLDSGLAELENMLKSADLNIGSVQVSIGRNDQNANTGQSFSGEEDLPLNSFSAGRKEVGGFVQNGYFDSGFADRMIGMNNPNSSIFSKI